MLESLFAKAVGAAGEQYVEARQNLFSQPRAAEYLLREIETSQDEQRKWIAEMMLERARDPARFRKIEEAFCDKVIVLNECFPHVDRAGVPVHDMTTTGLLLPNEPAPYVIPEARRSADMIKAMDWYLKFVRMEDSRPWRLMLAETALKGFGAKDYWLPMQPDSRQRWATAEHRGIVLYNDYGPSIPTADVFDNYAMLALGKLREKRIRPLAARRAADDSPEHYVVRRMAVRTLHYLGEPGAVPILMRIIENTQATQDLSGDAVIALGDLGDETAIPTLEQVLRRPELGPTVFFVERNEKIEAAVKDAIARIRKRAGSRP